jgi:hypothetical protein
MSDLPKLPEGHVAHLTWFKEHEGRYYEFLRVYDPSGGLERGRSFWVTMPADFAGPGPMRALSWDDCKRRMGAHAPTFEEFSSEYLAPGRLDELFARAGQKPQSTIDPVEGEPIGDEPPRPWTYSGVRSAGRDFVACSGYVPCELDDDAVSARDAATVLEADRVILRDAGGRLLSVRDWEGRRVSTQEATAILRAEIPPGESEARPVATQ